MKTVKKPIFLFFAAAVLVAGGIFAIESHTCESSNAKNAASPGIGSSHALAQAEAPIGWPLSEGERREKKLTFGMYVTPDPEQNPIDPPERFTGYHTGLDLEILPEEENEEVPVLAACDGKIVSTKEIAGY